MTYPYVPGNPKHMSGANGTVTRIVIHATCSATKDGGAMQNAHYFQSDNAGGLAHYVVDPDQVVQCCKEDTACWHAPPNRGSIGIELTDPQGLTNVQADAKDPHRWADADHEKMLRLAAKLVVEIANRHQVPLLKLSVADLKAGKHGICGHVDVSQAFGQSSHDDPQGAFPWAHFLDLVHAAVKASAPAKPTPAPAKPLPPHPAWWTHTVQVGEKDQSVASALKVIGDPNLKPQVTLDDIVAGRFGDIQRRIGEHVTGALTLNTANAIANGTK
jgi:N-acetyl-anhydromuramyl-L-alanine amidase AmpD